MATPVAAAAAVHYAAPAHSPITSQILAFRAKVEEVIAYRTTPRYTTTAQEEKTSQDSIDILADIRYVLKQLKLPVAERDQVAFFDETHMPTAINDDATAEEIAACDALIARIEGLGVDLSSARGLASFQYITKIALTAQDQLAKNAAIRDSSIESLGSRTINPLEAMGLEVLLSDLENAQENITLSFKSYQDGSRNIFTREAESKFLEVVHQTNTAALDAIRALGTCIARQLSTEPTDAAGGLLREKLSNLSTRARAVFANLSRTHGSLNRTMHAAYTPSAAREYAGAADGLEVVATPAQTRYFGGGGGAARVVGFGGGSTPGDGSGVTEGNTLMYGGLGQLPPAGSYGLYDPSDLAAASAPTPASATASAYKAEAVTYHGSDAPQAAVETSEWLAAFDNVAYPPLQDVVFALENIPNGGRFEVRGSGPGMSWEEGIAIDVADAISSARLPPGDYEFKIVHISDEGKPTWSKGANFHSAAFTSGEPVVVTF